MSRASPGLLPGTLAAGLLLALVGTPLPAAVPDSPAADGWYTWRVAAVDDAPSWCCLSWNQGKPTSMSCDLDLGNLSYGDGNDDKLPKTGEMQIYVRMTANAATRIRALSPACPVETADTIVDLGVTEADASLRRLIPYVTDAPVRHDGVLAAVAVHRDRDVRRSRLPTRM